MANGKIERRKVLAQRDRAEKPAAPVQATKVDAATLAAEGIEVRKSYDPVLAAGGDAVSATATDQALFDDLAVWGQKPPLAAINLKSLTEKKAKELRVELLKEKKALRGRLDGRAGELDPLWNGTYRGKRAELLGSYQEDLRNSLNAVTRTTFKTALDRAKETVQAQDDLRAKAKSMGLAKNADPKNKRDRSALAAQLVAARAAARKAVDDATHVVDSAGLKYERLALTEKALDPTGGQHSAYGSMSGLFNEYVVCSFMIDSLDLVRLNPEVALMHELDKEMQDAIKNEVVEDHWREEDLRAKALLEETLSKARASKLMTERVAQAGREGNVAKMSASDLEKLRRGRP
jgi:hypothetical protein